MKIFEDLLLESVGICWMCLRLRPAIFTVMAGVADVR